MMIHHYLEFLICGWIGNIYFKQEPVQLCFWQMIGSLLFNWILNSHNHKWRSKWIGLTVYRNLPFFHYFKQCSLRFCRGTVDFIDQNDIAEDGSLLEIKSGLPRIEYRGSNHITWHKIGRKLNTRKTHGYASAEQFCS